MARRHAFFISDRTGLTSESMGEALLDQFSGIEFRRTTYPFVDTPDKAREMVNIINRMAEITSARPLVFSSIISQEIREIIQTSAGMHLSFFDAFLSRLETELGVTARHSVGRNHGIYDAERYEARMEAVNFSLNHDDGVSAKDLKNADVILMGVSRSGKTPTCLYMAMQYGIRAANYPFIADDMDNLQLPAALKPFQQKLFGLTINPERLAAIREERRENSRYASLRQCRMEVGEVEALFRKNQIRYLNSTNYSVEEISTRILDILGMSRRMF